MISNWEPAFSKVAVTGALGGIGLAVVKLLHSYGIEVVAIDRAPTSGGSNKLNEIAPNNSTYICADLTNSADLENLINKLNEKNSTFPDALICLAGIVVSGDLVSQNDSDIEKVIDTNLISQAKISREFIKNWRNKKIAGNIIFISSWVDHVPWPGITPYAASKAGLVALCRGIARENAIYGIRSNLVSPGIVNIGMAAKQWNDEADYRARASRAIPLGRLQEPEEVATSVIFLLSKAASYMTGSNLLIDGGSSLYPLDPEEVK